MSGTTGDLATDLTIGHEVELQTVAQRLRALEIGQEELWEFIVDRLNENNLLSPEEKQKFREKLNSL